MTTTLAAPITTAPYPVPTRQDLEALCQTAGPCLTVYLPEHRRGAGTRASAAWLDQLRPEFAAALAARGIPPAEAEALLARLPDPEEHPRLTHGHGESIALFASPSLMRLFSLPAGQPARWSVAHHFLVAPLLGALEQEQSFRLLVLAQKRMRLLRVDPTGPAELPWPAAVPASFEEFRAIDEPNHELSNHTGATRHARFGTGADSDQTARDLHDYYRAIDRALAAPLRQAALPLVVAGVASEAARFAALCHYAALVPEPVILSGDGGLGDPELALRARAARASYIPEPVRRARAEFDRAAQDHLLLDAGPIRAAASRGRVATLLLAAPHLAPPASEEALNHAIVGTLAHGGAVVTLTGGPAPFPGAMAALLRYALSTQGEPQ